MSKKKFVGLQSALASSSLGCSSAFATGSTSADFSAHPERVNRKAIVVAQTISNIMFFITYLICVANFLTGKLLSGEMRDSKNHLVKYNP